MRLIDLHVDWLYQYASETVIHAPEVYPDRSAQLAQLDGYLQATRAAFLSCSRTEADWASQSRPWHALGDLITRVEAEFSGRLLIGPDDFARWMADRDGLAWGLIAVRGFDALVRSPEDLEHLPRLFERGVRLFQPVQGFSSLLAGNPGLTPLGFAFFEAASRLVPDSAGPRPLVDLAGMNQASISDALGWFEADPSRLVRVKPVHTGSTAVTSGSTESMPLDLENLRRLRALGGHFGVAVSPPELLRATIEEVAALPFLGRVGFEGIAITSGFPTSEARIPRLSTAAEVVAWLQAEFDRPIAKDLSHDNARELVTWCVGVARSI